jgi:hypothetical protein
MKKIVNVLHARWKIRNRELDISISCQEQEPFVNRFKLEIALLVGTNDI